jgi:site-specific DNA-methyltransferase (adenine-specific)
MTEPVIIGDATLYCGDCLDVLPTLGKVDCVVTDPPYGIADIWVGGFNEHHGWGKAKSEALKRNEWDNKKPDKSTFDLIRSISDYQIIWGGNYFELPLSRGWLVWNKPERNFTLAEAELAWTNQDKVIRVFDCHRSDSDRIHPTQKPLKLMEWCLRMTEGTICDCYMGSGTTGVAALKLGRKFIGVEICKEYFDIAVNRISKEANQMKLEFTVK